MSPYFSLLRSEGAFRRVFVGLCVLAHLAVTTGFPLPQPKDLPAGSARFPCEKHRCGCTSAEHCWRSCCCMSTAEKLAWAKQNGVTPPDYLLAAAAREPEQDSAGSCCSHRRESEESPSCCAVAHRSCCSKSDDTELAKDATPGDHGQSPEAQQLVWVHGIQAQRCQGLATMWVIAGAVLPPPPPITAPVNVMPPVWFVPAKICRWQSLCSPPDVPPPRCA